MCNNDCCLIIFGLKSRAFQLQIVHGFRLKIISGRALSSPTNRLDKETCIVKFRYVGVQKLLISERSRNQR